MGMPKTNQKTPATATAKADKSSSKPTLSEAAKMGRYTRLYFSGEEVPILDKIEFRFSRQYEPEFRQRIHNLRAFRWQEVAKATSLIFLEYAVWAQSGRKGEFWFDGAARSHLITPLCNAIYNGGQNLLEIFCEPLKTQHVYYAKNIFLGDNRSGWADDSRERRVTFNPDFLPPDCVEIYWKVRGELPLKKRGDLNALAKNFRKVLGIPEAPAMPPAGEESLETVSAPVESPAAEKVIPPAKPEAREKMPRTATELLGRQPSAPPADPKLKPGPAPKADAEAAGYKFEFKTPLNEEPKENPKFAPESPPSKIDPKLFEIQNPDEQEWLDSDPLINFGNPNSQADVWKIRDASEGVAIFGGIGSGKTSGSGTAISKALLLAGYGGMVLTAKTDEAKRWLRLCEQTGRASDVIHVTPGSGHKLNVLQYELQRPGDRLSVTDDLIGLFRCIIAVMTRSREEGKGDDFWTLAPNVLMKNLFEVFHLSGESFSPNNFVRFINLAPTEPDKPWHNLGCFTALLQRAEKGAASGTDADRRMFTEALEYWTRSFPKEPDVTRGGIVTTFEAMAKTMNGRGIYEMICTDTNLTPEMILSGKIVILDFPVKQGAYGNMMIQQTWKLLYQQAIERRADKGLTTARPAFLWEDEGHEFFSQHDVRFQPTARDCRACHVIISQNLHNFFSLGHGKDSVFAVLEAINTLIFHTNGDSETNRWASDKIGEVKEKHFVTSGLVRGFTPEDYSFFTPPGQISKSAGSLDITETSELGMPPDKFSELLRGGPDTGKCEAVILWLSHKFECNQGKKFAKRMFHQEKRP